MACPEFEDWLQAELDARHPLEPLPAEWSDHVAGCPACARTWHAWRQLPGWFQGAPDIAPQRDLASAVVSAWLTEARPVQALPADTRPPALRQGPRGRLWFWGVGLIAATWLVGVGLRVLVLWTPETAVVQGPRMVTPPRPAPTPTVEVDARDIAADPPPPILPATTGIAVVWSEWAQSATHDYTAWASETWTAAREVVVLPREAAVSPGETHVSAEPAAPSEGGPPPGWLPAASRERLVPVGQSVHEALGFLWTALPAPPSRGS